MAIDVDLREAAKGVKVVVVLRGLRVVKVRMALATVFLRLARLVAPFDLRVEKDPSEPMLLYCPYCGHETVHELPPKGIRWPSCGWCGRQFMVRDGEAVKEPPPCDCDGCGRCEPYGWVPEDGCPVHDTGTAEVLEVGGWQATVHGTGVCVGRGQDCVCLQGEAEFVGFQAALADAAERAGWTPRDETW